jgi:hypothetical protein
MFVIWRLLSMLVTLAMREIATTRGGATLAAWGLTLAVILWGVAGPNLMDEVSSEHGIWEMTQAGMLLGALGLCGWVCVRSLPADLFTGSLSAFCTLGLATLLILEVDLRGLDIPDWVKAAMNGTVRNIWLSGAWVVLALVLIRLWPRNRPVDFRWVWSGPIRLWYGSGFFWVAGAAIESIDFNEDRRRFIEEALECAACAFALGAAWAMFSSQGYFRRRGRPTQSREPILDGSDVRDAPRNHG